MNFRSLLEFDGVPDIGGRLVPTLQCAIDDYLAPECRIVLIPLEQVATIKSLLLDYDYMNLPPGDLDISNWIGNLAETFNPQPKAKKIEILAAQMDRFGHDIPGWLYHPELVAVAAQAFACLPSSKQATA